MADARVGGPPHVIGEAANSRVITMNVRKIVLLTAACAINGMLASTATANTATCADSGQVIQALNDRFGEALAGNAVSRTGSILEVYSNDTSRTWTILVTLPDRGLSCLVASGSGDQRLASQLSDLTG